MNYYELNLQRKKEIEECLLELMQEVPFREITVKDLAQRMHFVRKTFYHYFPSKWACLESLTDRLILECNLKVMQELPEDAELLQVYIFRILYWQENRKFLEAILRNNLSAYFVERFLAYILREDITIQSLLKAGSAVCDEDILFFFMSGQVYLLLKWCAAGFPLSTEEMARKSLRLLHEPLFPPETK